MNFYPSKIPTTWYWFTFVVIFDFGLCGIVFISPHYPAFYEGDSAIMSSGDDGAGAGDLSDDVSNESDSDSSVVSGGKDKRKVNTKVNAGTAKQQAEKKSPEPSIDLNVTESGTSGKSPEVVAPLMMGFGQTRSGRKIVPSQNFDILYLATKFGVSAEDSDDSNDADFAGREGPSFDLESGSDDDIGEVSGGDGEDNVTGVTSDEEEMEIGEEDSMTECEVMEAKETKGQEGGMDDTYLVCSVCLQESLSEEVVVCDKCGWSAHEDCYGILPSDTDDDNEETVPWFCDACKFGSSPTCELCPNTGGLYKQTVNGKWVHIVCCLYTPGVSYLQPSELSYVVLDEVMPQKWGQKVCQLCENPLLAKTGVCIQCDAGMCRSSFHVTCAMKHGLLCEVDIPQEELDKRDSIFDAYFAHCKLHSKKEVVKHKKRNWIAAEQQHFSHSFDKSNMKYVEALKRASRSYLLERQQRISTSYIPANVDLVQERFLHNSPTAMRLFARKAEKIGLPLHVGRKPAVAPKPALTIEYVQYHSESIQDLLKLSRVIPEMIKAQGLLDKEQRALLERSAEMDLQLKQAQALQKEMLGEITDLCSLWDIPMSPRVILKGRNPSTSSLGGLTKECSVCCESTSQHLMVCCDTCQSLYHIHCLDPPLDRVPKKTKTYGWQCEECCCCSDDEPPEPVAVTEVSGKRGRSTRTGRRVIKPKYYSSP
jgi:hypothetical protein